MIILNSVSVSFCKQQKEKERKKRKKMEAPPRRWTYLPSIVYAHYPQIKNLGKQEKGKERERESFSPTFIWNPHPRLRLRFWAGVIPKLRQILPFSVARREDSGHPKSSTSKENLGSVANSEFS